MLSRAISLLGKGALTTPQVSVMLFSTHQRFPDHKELFADDYYDNDTKENPYAKPHSKGDDFESSHKGVHRSTPQGILANYKKQINLTPQDLIQKDYWDKFEKLTEDTARTLSETKPE